jgi:Rho family protein
MSKTIIIPNRNIKSQIEQFRESKNRPSTNTKKKSKKKKSNNNNNPALPPGFVDIQREKDLFIITLIPQITSSILLDLLEFLYTGLLSNKTNAQDLKNLSVTFQLPYLANYCDNIIQNTTEYNPSIGTYLNDEAGSRAQEYFYNKALYSDIKIQVSDGTVFYAHKSLISARCEVLRAMFSSSFIEASQSTITIQDVSSEAFSAFLKYIYTDHCPIEETPDSIGILELSNRFNLRRLTSLCELKITKQVEVATKDDIAKADIDIIGILLASQLHTAKQLEGFCLHFISSNYQPMKNRLEWNKLDGQNLKYVEENQWPPKSYLEELVAYERAVKGEEEVSKCTVM